MLCSQALCVISSILPEDAKVQDLPCRAVRDSEFTHPGSQPQVNEVNLNAKTSACLPAFPPCLPAASAEVLWSLEFLPVRGFPMSSQGLSPKSSSHFDLPQLRWYRTI